MKLIFLVILLVFCANVFAQNTSYVSDVWVADLGNGKYKNPILYADYSDPDICRVGDDYYMTSSSFNCIPGLPILHSKDLINWEIIGHALQHQEPTEMFNYASHGNGVWAPAIRYHNGLFYIYWGDPDNGIFMVKTGNPAGRWDAPIQVMKCKGIIDTCPFWDDDGHAWIGHGYAGSRAGLKSVLGLIEMTPDGTQIIGEDKIIYDGHEENETIEGVKIYKRNGYYYIMCPAGGVSTGWQLAMRSKNLYGPYEWKIVMNQGSTKINGPHQGGWVDTPNGEEDWFIHFQDIEAYGRVVHLQPLHWIDDWPVIGITKDDKYCGEPVEKYTKPQLPKQTLSTPLESDNFDSNKLGYQWQWHANSNALWYFTDAKNSRLRLFSVPIIDGYRNLWDVPNLLLQKFPAPNFTATAKVNFHPSNKYIGERAGLIVMGLDYAGLIFENTNQGIRLSQNICYDARNGNQEIADSNQINISDNQNVWLQVEIRQEKPNKALCTFKYSFDGQQFATLGQQFYAKEGLWIGAKIGMFITRNKPSNDGGWIDIDSFIISE